MSWVCLFRPHLTLFRPHLDCDIHSSHILRRMSMLADGLTTRLWSNPTFTTSHRSNEILGLRLGCSETPVCFVEDRLVFVVMRPSAGLYTSTKTKRYATRSLTKRLKTKDSRYSRSSYAYAALTLGRDPTRTSDENRAFETL